MKSPVVALRIAGTLFALFCLAHVLRLVAGAEVVVAGRQMPFWPSIVAVIVTGGLAVWLWLLAKPQPHTDIHPA